MEGCTLATATPCIYISLRMGMEPKKTGRRGRERRERQGRRGEAGRGMEEERGKAGRGSVKWTRKGGKMQRGRGNYTRHSKNMYAPPPHHELSSISHHSPFTPSPPHHLTPFMMRNSTTLLWPRAEARWRAFLCRRPRALGLTDVVDSNRSTSE